MLAKLILELDTTEKISYQKTSLFQGVLMEQIDPDYAEALHLSGLKPYRQSILSQGEKTFWEITALNKEAYEKILLPMSDPNLTQVMIKHNDLQIRIKNKVLQSTDYQNLIDTYYLGKCERSLYIKFSTPTAFKQNSRYVFYPDVTLMIQSLMNKFDAFAVDQSIKSDEVLEQLAENTSITGYNLKSMYFNLEGVRIPAFVGQIKLKIHGPQPLVNLIHLLFHFGEYSGIGIKNAIGMGSIKILDISRKGDHHE